MDVFMLFFVGVGLSMDAFSLSLIYGTYGLGKRNEIILSVIVGLFHFFMPLIGYLFGSFIFMYYDVNVNFIVGLIFGIIGMDMIISSFSGRDISILSGLISYIMFAFSVSIDSFTTGIGLNAISSNYLISSFIFMFCSGFFTYFGLIMGNILNKKFGRYANILEGFIFIILVIIILFK